MSDLVEKIVKRDDIRAKTPEPLSEKVALAIGISLARYLKGWSKIAIGYDMRLSSLSLTNALTKGLFSQDFQVFSLGQCNTEMISYVSGKEQVPAVMVTASHNPKEYNGFKILRTGAVLIGREALEKIVREAEKLLRVQDLSGVDKSTPLNIDDSYVEKVLLVSNIFQEGYGKKIPVVIDAGNGMGGRVFQKITPRLPWLEPIYYYDTPDGDIPSGIMPNTLEPRYLERLAKEVAENKEAFLGICFDGDADRVAFVYRATGGEVRTLTPSQVGGLIIKQILEKKGWARKILYSLPCSALISELIEEFGGIPVMTPVGYGKIRERLALPKNSDCPFAMEHSGHYFYRDFYRADSGMITALILLDMVGRLAVQGENLSSIIFPWQTRYFQSNEINFDFNDPNLMKERIDYFRKKMKIQPIKEYSPGDPIDTTRILKEEHPLEGYSDCRWWFCLRPSSSEPKLRLIAEIILNEEMPWVQRVKLGPKILTQKMDQLINLIGPQYLAKE